MNSLEQKNLSSIDSVISNDDLVTEILLRLPAKSVLKFKLVSKKWLTIISDSTFAMRHTHLNPHNTSAFLLKLSFFFKQPPSYKRVSLLGQSLANVPLPSDFLHFDPNKPGRTYICQSSNGLLLCSKWRRYSAERSGPTYYVYNPTARQFAVLPSPPGHGFRFNWIQLVFDPSKSPHYQVVCTHFFNSKLEIQVYSSETKGWKISVKQENFDSLYVKFANGVFWNGAIHWISLMGNGFSFLLDKEYLQTIPRPPLPENWQTQNFGYFGASAGHLHFIGFVAGNKNPDDLNMGISSPTMSTDQMVNSSSANICNDETIVVYAMEKGCSKWFVKCCLHLDAIVMACSEIIEDPTLSPFSVKVLSFIEGNNETGPLLVMKVPGKIMSYSFKDKSFKNIFRFAPFRRASCYAFNYVETLAWV
ncbi:unnamed protein product [Dovyalis caffra]|uniref:F-box domain-containing protein n=1 Tax=Dovyalis caffra TaxID=77055 RepID=A0AAV1S2K1_9ROSI|nr:unnamed protein product [Dovyalis caffra]